MESATKEMSVILFPCGQLNLDLSLSLVDGCPDV